MNVFIALKGTQFLNFIWILFESTAYLKFTKLQYFSFLWLSLQGDYRVTDEALLAKTA